MVLIRLDFLIAMRGNAAVQTLPLILPGCINDDKSKILVNCLYLQTYMLIE